MCSSKVAQRTGMQLASASRNHFPYVPADFSSAPSIIFILPDPPAAFVCVVGLLAIATIPFIAAAGIVQMAMLTGGYGDNDVSQSGHE